MFFATLPLIDILVRDGETQIHDGVLYEGAESFDAEISITNKEEEEAKTVEKSRLQNLYHKANIKAQAVYYTVIKHSGHSCILRSVSLILYIQYISLKC